MGKSGDENGEVGLRERGEGGEGLGEGRLVQSDEEKGKEEAT